MNVVGGCSGECWWVGVGGWVWWVDVVDGCGGWVWWVDVVCGCAGWVLVCEGGWVSVGELVLVGM